MIKGLDNILNSKDRPTHRQLEWVEDILGEKVTLSSAGFVQIRTPKTI